MVSTSLSYHKSAVQLCPHVKLIDSTPMERAAKVLGKMKLGKAGIYGDQIAIASWPMAVGKTIAKRTRAVSVYDGILLVEVADGLWEKNLKTLESQILGKLSRTVGVGKVRGLRFRIGVARREPQREERIPIGVDEADTIDDAIFRRIYINSRKRSTA